MFWIELAGTNDRAQVLAVTLSAYAEYEREMPPERWRMYRKNIEQSIMDPSGTVLVARDTNTIKGSVLFCEPDSGFVGNNAPEMRLLAVPEEFRNQGIAGALIDECERIAESYGVLTLHTTRLMQTAKAMYERRGYVHYPEIDFEPASGFIVWGYKKIIPQRVHS